MGIVSRVFLTLSASLVLAGLLVGSVPLSVYSEKADVSMGPSFWVPVFLLGGAVLFLVALIDSFYVQVLRVRRQGTK